MTALSLGTCAADMSAFYVLAQLPAEARAEIRARLQALTTVPVMARDIAMTRDHLRSAATASGSGNGVADYGPDAGLQHLAELIESDIARSDKLPVVDSGQTQADQLIAAAIPASMPLWCDDNALRQRARNARLAAFSTVDLLTALTPAGISQGRAADGHWPRAWEAMASSYITDLPLTAASVITVASYWQQYGPAHTAIARPGWWDYQADSWGPAWLQIATAAAASQPHALTQITMAALTGALQAVTPGYRTQRYQQVAAMALVGCHNAAQPAPADFLASLTSYVGQHVAARPGYVLAELISQLRERADVADPCGVAANLLPGTTPPNPA